MAETTNQSKTPKWIAIVVVALLVFAVLQISFSSRQNKFLKNTTQSLTGKKENLSKKIVSANKKVEMMVPADWKEDPDLNDDADLQASQRRKEMYVVVISESKADFDEAVDLKKYSELVYDPFIKTLKNYKERKAPVTLTMNGNKIVQYEFEGVVDNLKVVYLNRLVETPKGFLQILTWTLPSLYEENYSTLQSIVDTVRAL